MLLLTKAKPIAFALFFAFSKCAKTVGCVKSERVRITQKSAYYMVQRLRKAWESDAGEMFGSVEVGEAYFGSVSARICPLTSAEP